MNRKDYESYYEKLDLLKIIRVLENPSDYNKIAVEVAKEEIISRNISEEEYDEAIQSLKVLKKNSQIKQEKILATKQTIKSRVNNKADKTIHTIDPLTSKSPR